MPELADVQTFWQNADAHAAFLHRVAAAIVERAVAIRQEDPPDPVTAQWRARQQWARSALSGADGALAKARQMLPALAVEANDSGLLSETGEVDAADAQIRNIVGDDAWLDTFTDYIPDAP
jgi:hypothetical protein